MFDDGRPPPVEAGCPAAILSRGQGTRPFGYRSGQALPVQRRSAAAFTLTELLVAMAVVVLLVLLFTQLLKSATTIMTLGHKQMDADSQARQLLDRMARDFAQMVKRSDVDYYIKSSWFATGSPPGPTGVRSLPQPGNDKIAFYSAVSGYYPSTGSQSPVSLVGYRINSQNKLERMSKGLVWNAVSTTDTPIVFIPVPLASPLPAAELPVPPPNALPTPAWLEIASPGTWSGSEVIGPQVFRFEYYYLLRGQTAPESAPAPSATPYNAILSDAPWDTRICSCPTPAPTATVSPAPTATPTPIPSPTAPAVCCHVAPEGMQDVAAVVVVIAVIDPKSKLLLSDTTSPPQIAQVASQLIDWGDTTCADCPNQTQWQTTSGLLRARWQSKLDGITNLPRPAISGIRVYERYLYLSPPTLITP